MNDTSSAMMSSLVSWNELSDHLPRLVRSVGGTVNSGCQHKRPPVCLMRGWMRRAQTGTERCSHCKRNLQETVPPDTSDTAAEAWEQVQKAHVAAPKLGTEQR